MLRSLVVSAVCLIAPAAFAADTVDVMVLATRHFANPGQDLANAAIDDVLSPRRQAELGAVLDGLAAFAPNRIAVEAEADDLPDHALPDYRAVRSGTRPASRNEIEQIGFRLASRLGLEAVHGIDVAGDFPFEALQAFAERTGRAADLQKTVDGIVQSSRDFETRAHTATIATLLRADNDPIEIRRSHAVYTDALDYGSGADQPGVRLAAAWAARNLGICARLHQLARPGDRIVVLYGAGHAYLLRQCVSEAPGWRLIEPSAYLPR